MKSRGNAGWALALATSLAWATPALAHHSYAVFDRNRTITLKGTVREFMWTNPHVGFVLTVSERGKAVDYAVEAQSPNALERTGWKADTLKPGDRLTVRIHPFRDGSNGGSFVQARTSAGKTLEPYY